MNASKPLCSFYSIPRNVRQYKVLCSTQSLSFIQKSRPGIERQSKCLARPITCVRRVHDGRIDYQKKSTFENDKKYLGRKIDDLNSHEHTSTKRRDFNQQPLANQIFSDPTVHQTHSNEHFQTAKKHRIQFSHEKTVESTLKEEIDPENDNISAITQLLEDNCKDSFPLSTLSSGLTDNTIQENIGIPSIRNLRLEAAVRMLADRLLIYNIIDRTLSYQRHILKMKQTVKQLSESKKQTEKFDLSQLDLQAHEALSRFSPAVYPGVQQDVPIFMLETERLSSLSENELEDLHMYLSKNFLFLEGMGYGSFLNYLNDTLRSPGAAPILYKMSAEDPTKLSRAKKISQPNKNQQLSSLFENSKQYLKATAKNVYEFDSNAASNALNQALLSVLEDFSPQMLPKIARTLMLYPGLPDLFTFTILIKQLNLYHLEVPARLVLEAILFSGQPLNGELYRAFLKLAISTTDRLGFLKLVNIYDLNTVMTPDNLPSPINHSFRKRFNPLRMSRFITREWPTPDPSNGSIRAKFFGDDTNSFKPYYFQHSVLNYIVMISGFLRFHMFFWIDLAIRKMVAEELPLTLEILSMNMKAAILSNDCVKATWTWDEIVDLPKNLARTPEFDKAGNRINRCFYDQEVYELSVQAAKKFNNLEMLMLVEAYNTKMEERRLVHGHLNMEIPPEYYPLDVNGRPIKQQISPNQHPNHHQSIKSRITNALSSTFLNPFSFKTKQNSLDSPLQEYEGSENYGLVASTSRPGLDSPVAALKNKPVLGTKSYVKEFEKEQRQGQSIFYTLPSSDQMSKNILATKFGGMLAWEPEFGVGEEQFRMNGEGKVLDETDDIFSIGKLENEMSENNSEEEKEEGASKAESDNSERTVFILDETKKWFEIF